MVISNTIGVMVFGWLLAILLQSPKLPLLAARVSKPFPNHAKRKFGKKRVNLFLARFKPTTHQLPSQMHNQINQFIFVIILIILGLHYHVSHSNISINHAQIKITYKWHT